MWGALENILTFKFDIKSTHSNIKKKDSSECNISHVI